MAKVTNDKLAEMMNKSFIHLENKMDERFNAVDKRFEVIDERFEAVDKRFDAVDKRFDKVEYRLDAIEGKFLTSHENRISKLEDEMRVIKTSRGK